MRGGGGGGGGGGVSALHSTRKAGGGGGGGGGGAFALPYMKGGVATPKPRPPPPPPGSASAEPRGCREQNGIARPRTQSRNMVSSFLATHNSG